MARQKTTVSDDPTIPVSDDPTIHHTPPESNPFVFGHASSDNGTTANKQVAFSLRHDLGARLEAAMLASGYWTETRMVDGKSVACPRRTINQSEFVRRILHYELKAKGFPSSYADDEF